MMMMLMMNPSTMMMIMMMKTMLGYSTNTKDDWDDDHDVDDEPEHYDI